MIAAILAYLAVSIVRDQKAAGSKEPPPARAVALQRLSYLAVFAGGLVLIVGLLMMWHYLTSSAYHEAMHRQCLLFVTEGDRQMMCAEHLAQLRADGVGQIVAWVLIGIGAVL